MFVFLVYGYLCPVNLGFSGILCNCSILVREAMQVCRDKQVVQYQRLNYFDKCQNLCRDVRAVFAFNNLSFMCLTIRQMSACGLIFHVVSGVRCWFLLLLCHLAAVFQE